MANISSYFTDAFGLRFRLTFRRRKVQIGLIAAISSSSIFLLLNTSRAIYGQSLPFWVSIPGSIAALALGASVWNENLIAQRMDRSGLPVQRIKSLIPAIVCISLVVGMLLVVIYKIQHG